MLVVTLTTHFLPILYNFMPNKQQVCNLSYHILTISTNMVKIHAILSNYCISTTYSNQTPEPDRASAPAERLESVSCEAAVSRSTRDHLIRLTLYHKVVSVNQCGAVGRYFKLEGPLSICCVFRVPQENWLARGSVGAFWRKDEVF